MKTFDKCAAQGDVLFIKMSSSINPNAVGEEILPENGELIVTHSETGHHHVMDPSHAKMYRGVDKDYESVLVIDRPTPIVHKRSHDTHEPIMFDIGTYKVRRQREHTPEGFRRVED